MAYETLERNPTEALRRLLRMGGPTDLSGQSQSALDETVDPRLANFEPTEQDLMDEQLGGIDAQRKTGGPVIVPSRESLKDQQMGKIKKLLGLGDIEQGRKAAAEAQHQAGEIAKAKIAGQAQVEAAQGRTSASASKWVIGADGQKAYRVPMPGDTPYDAVAERQKAQQQQAATSPYQQERTARIRQDIDNLRGQVGTWTTGLGGSIINNAPLGLGAGSPARNFHAQIDSLKANIAFGELAEMRAASKTGGALGNISDRESALLGATLGSLDPTQSPEAFIKQLDQIKESIDRWEAAKKQFGAGGQQSAPGSLSPADVAAAANARHPGSATIAGGGGGRQIRYDMNGQPIR